MKSRAAALNQEPKVTINCLPSFKALRVRIPVVTINGKPRINSTYEDFLEVIKMLLKGAVFNEQWYLSRYSDVAEAVAAGVFKSGQHHFIEVGYFEGRHPREFEVDEEWYLTTYPDVADGIGKGVLTSARQHFNEHGYEEGRSPCAS
jgi:hypothetical protein